MILRKLLSWSFFFCFIFLNGCKKSDNEADQRPKGYLRYFSVDFRSFFYWDGKINATGDSVLFNPDGTPYGQTGNARADAQNKPTVQLTSGGWNDNSSPDNPGTYAYVDDVNNPQGYSYWPNGTHRTELAPIVSGINLLNWGALAGGEHQLLLKTALPTFINGVEVTARLDSILLTNYVLEAGAVHSVFLINRATSFTNSGVFPFYRTDIRGFNSGIGGPANNQFYSSLPDIVTIKDHPEQFSFNDSSAYLRFLNFTPSYFDPGFTENTSTLDVYLTPVDAENKDGADVLVAARLKRFASSVDAPFYEIKLNKWLRGDTANGAYYRIKVFREGQSKATGFVPLANSLIPTYNVYDNIDANNKRSRGLNEWLIRSDGKNFFPTINTIAFAVSSAAGGNNPLILKTCFVYQRAGLNARYYR